MANDSGNCRAREPVSMLGAMRTRNLVVIMTLLLSASSIHSQDPPSLGEIAARLKAEKERRMGASAPSPDKNTSVVTSGLNSDLNDLTDPELYMAGVRNLFAQERFADLERIATAGRMQKTRFAGGGWKLYTFYVALNAPANREKAVDSDWEGHLLKLKRWISAQPNSITAPVALADSYLNY